MSVKIMFWNVQNAWNYTVTTPEEMAAYLLIGKRQRLYGDFLEKSHDPDIWKEAAQALLGGKKVTIGRESLQAAITAWEKAPVSDAQAQLAALIACASKAGKLKKDLAGALKKAYIWCYNSGKGEVSKPRRGWIVDIFNKISPHILIVVEPATTKAQVEFSLKRQNSPVSNIHDLASEAQDLGGVWVAYQLAVSFGTKWECWASPINSTVAWIANRKVESKNSFFELYTVLWDSSSPVRLTDTGGFLPGKYPERAPYWLRFGVPQGGFYLIFTHAVFGNVTERKDTLKVLAQDLAKQPFASNPVIVMGDFNLDTGSRQNKHLYDALNMGVPLTNGVKSTFTSKRTARPDAYTKNAYDQIFVRGFPEASKGGVYDFAEAVFHLTDAFKTRRKLSFNPFDEVVKVSDHLPTWCEVDFP